MNPEFQDQARRLQELRHAAALQNAQTATGSSVVEPWGAGAAQEMSLRGGNSGGQQAARDPMIYPDFYAPSGFDMMGILIRIRQRPNPQIEIGNIDSGVALVLCDAAMPDTPIVYCSEPFEALTGYRSTDILGRNCRFLQHPPGGYCQDQNTLNANAVARKEIREANSKGDEARVRLWNYKRSGQMFANLLTLIPISWEENQVGKRYIVGFQADEGTLYKA